MMYFLIAWRNLWRNKRRSIISISSVCFAVLLATFMRAMQLGSYDRMIENIVGQYTGHLQIHTKDYKDSQSLDESYVWNDSLNSELLNTKGIINYSSRIESFVLISTGEISKGIGIIGIDPERENQFTKLKNKLTDGEYLPSNGNNLLLAEGLAEHLDVAVNDTVILFGQGLFGMSANDLFRVIGIVKFPSPDLNDRMAFLSLPTAQTFFSLEERITSTSLFISESDQLFEQKKVVSGIIGDDLIVETWEELMPDLVQMIEMDNASGLIILIILYLVIAFGLFGTTMMIAIERRREIATLLSIGMKRARMMGVIVFETVMLSIIGLIVGLGITIPVVYYFNIHPIRLTGEMAEVVISYGMEPILPTSIDPMIFVNQLFIVATIAFVTSIYPIISIRKLDIVESLRS